MTIEQVLRLSPEEIEKRVAEERRKIPTLPGDGYLDQKLMRFKTPEWNFLNYLAHYSPQTFLQELESYACYDGNEARAAIIEGLRERYILAKLSLESTERRLEREKQTVKT